ncbi:hypothetical protein [Anaeromyxobacter sp. SG17]|uniref:hypothetical protein n=1 Tax=Anaeromyxobacter sp. SG17 TaxID=2925405 RepID=UPI001F5650B8|nr:hypothetical protein [Anaeromyxobacter sp. SG17]
MTTTAERIARQGAEKWWTDIARVARERGGLLVTPEFLGADGAAVECIGPFVAAEVAASRRVFGFVAASGGRPHVEEVARVSQERRVWSPREAKNLVSGRGQGQAFRLSGDRDSHERLGDVEEGRSTLHVWRSARRWVLHPPHRQTRLTVEEPPTGAVPGLARATREQRRGAVLALQEALRDLHVETQGRARSPTPSQEFRASWNARSSSDGKLETVGALVLGPGSLVFASPDAEWRHVTTAALRSALGRASPEEVFEYMAQSGNGITNEWSQPFVVRAQSADAALARLMTRLRYRDNVAGHLRELWLACWPDMARDVIDEAEEVTSGRALDPAAAEYLGRIRTAARGASKFDEGRS